MTVLTVVFVVVALVAGIVIGALIFWLIDRDEDRREAAHPPPSPTPEGGRPGIPSKFNPATLPAALTLRLAGSPADGSPASATATPLRRVIWVDGGDEVLVHLDSLQTRMLDGALVASLDLETDQTGRSPVVVAFALGQDGGAGGLIAATPEWPSGDPALTARWGAAVRDALWNSLLRLADDHAQERGQAPQAIRVTSAGLELRSGEALQLTGVAGPVVPPLSGAPKH